MNENIVFDYLLANAWGLPLCRVSVSEDGVVQCQENREDTQRLQLEKAEVERIKAIVSEHAQILDYDSRELEMPSVFDGVTNDFEFKSSDGRTVSLMAFNIDEVKNPNTHFSKGWMRESVPGEVVVPVKLREIVKTFEEIAAILIQHGVDANCLRLTYGARKGEA